MSGESDEEVASGGERHADRRDAARAEAVVQAGPEQREPRQKLEANIEHNVEVVVCEQVGFLDLIRERAHTEDDATR